MKKAAISLTLLLALAFVMGTIGCGGNDEEDLRARLDEQMVALNAMDVQTIYDQKTPSYQSRVTVEEYDAFLRAAYADFLPMVESGQAEVVIEDVEFRIDGEWAYMTGVLSLDGTELFDYTDDSPDIWQKIDGAWYDVEENPAFPGYDASELPD